MNTARIKQVEEVSEISAITYGFMASKALFAALEFDVFTHIASGAGSLPDLAKATGIAKNRLVTLLTALKSLGLIAERDGHFTNAPATARYLVAGAAGDFRDYVSLVNGAFGYESFRHLDAALRPAAEHCAGFRQSQHVADRSYHQPLGDRQRQPASTKPASGSRAAAPVFTAQP